jgi:hypothetical protein
VIWQLKKSGLYLLSFYISFKDKVIIIIIIIIIITNAYDLLFEI